VVAETPNGRLLTDACAFALCASYSAAKPERSVALRLGIARSWLEERVQFAQPHPGGRAPWACSDGGSS
jgi:hypothetical protein